MSGPAAKPTSALTPLPGASIAVTEETTWDKPVAAADAAGESQLAGGQRESSSVDPALALR